MESDLQTRNEGDTSHNGHDCNNGNARPNGGTAHFEGIGWRFRLQQKRANYFLTLAKEIVIGNALQRGDEIRCYLVDCDGRKALLVFLDGKERPNNSNVQVNRITFLLKK